MCLSARSCKTPRKKRIIVVPRSPAYAVTPRFAMSAIERALKKESDFRTPVDVEAIYSLMSRWSSFNTVMTNEIIQRKFCQIIEFLHYSEGDYIYRKDDISDGWYFVFTGKIILVDAERLDPQNMKESNIPTQFYEELRRMWRQRYNYFTLEAEITKTQSFGLEELQEKKLRNMYAIAERDTDILRIDKFSYDIIISKVEKNIYEERYQLIEKIKELSILKRMPNVLGFVVEILKPINLPSGLVIDINNPLCNGFLIIKTGEIQVQKACDFSQLSFWKEDLIIGDRAINLPKGVADVPTKLLGDCSVLALPSIYPENGEKFSATVMKDSTCFTIDFDEFFKCVPREMQLHILELIIDKRSDQEVVDEWLRQKRNARWRIYKDQCVVEATEKDLPLKFRDTKQNYYTVRSPSPKCRKSSRRRKIPK